MRQPHGSRATGSRAAAGPMKVTGKRKVSRFTVLNLATLTFVVAYLAFDWWAITYLISH
jgi:hypothetical protein